MQIELTYKPKSPIIIEGFPSLGLVSTIATGFLIEHLNAKPIGKIWAKELEPMVAIHDKKVIEPIELYYVKKNNLIIINALTNAKGIEWEVADTILQLCKDLKAKELISIEGIGSSSEKAPKSFYYTNNSDNEKRLEKSGANPLKEGIASGVTAALMLKARSIKTSCIFAETHSQLPDSRAAAKIIETLDKLMDIKVDPKPLIKKAEEFEKKLKTLLNQTMTAKEEKAKKDEQTPSYFG